MKPFVPRLVLTLALGAALALPARADVPPVPEGAVDGELVDVDGALYEVREGVLVPLEEALAEDEAAEQPAKKSGEGEPGAGEPGEGKAGEAEPGAKKPPERPGVSVTASRVDGRPQQVMETDSVSEREIAETGARTLSDVLSQVAGLSVTSSLGTGEEVSVDGLDAKYVLILIDGRPVNGRVNNRVDTSRLPVSPADIERVEVVRGPMSALYGSEAMGGVINIITKRPTAGLHGAVDVTTRLTQKGIARGGLSANVSGSAGPVLFKLGASGLLEAGVDRAARDPDSGVVVDRPDGQLDQPHRRQSDVSGEIGVFLGDDWFLRAYGRAMSNEVETRVSSALPFRDNTRNTQAQLGIVAEGDVAPGHALYADLRYDLFTHLFQKLPDAGELSPAPFCEDKNAGGLRFFDPPCAATANVSSDATQHEGRGELRYTGALLKGQPFAEELLLSAGLVVTGELWQRLNGDGEDTLAGEGRRLSTAAYSEVMYRPFEFLSILPGVRLDVITPGAGQDPVAFALGPKLGVRADLPASLSVRASYGQGFRVPGFLERYLRFDHSELGYIVEGNADLRPETSQGLRAELLWAPLFGVELGAEGFLNLLHDLIGEQAVRVDDNGIPVYTYVNFARAYTSGLNLRASVRDVRGFSFDLGYQYLFAATDASGCPEDNPYFCSIDEGARALPLRAAHAGHARLAYRVAATDTTVFGRVDFMGERPLGEGKVAPAFNRLGAGLSQRLGERVELLASFDNLLDAYDPLYGPKPGRQANVTLRAGF